MNIPISWLKNRGDDLLVALAENRVVPFYQWSSNIAHFEEGVQHDRNSIEQWLDDTGFKHYSDHLYSNIQAIVFKDPVETSLFCMNFGITYTPYLDPDL